MSPFAGRNRHSILTILALTFRQGCALSEENGGSLCITPNDKKSSKITEQSSELRSCIEQPRQECNGTAWQEGAGERGGELGSARNIPRQQPEHCVQTWSVRARAR